MASSDDDEDLKRAIAMSLGETRRSPPPVIDLIDSDDEELRQAIALSLDGNGPRPNSTASKVEVTSSRETTGYDSTTAQTIQSPVQQRLESASTASAKPTSLPGMFGLDRKAMEQERLARLSKRKRSASPERPSKMAMKAAPAHTLVPVNSEGKHHDTPQSGIQYPQGALKRTWAYKHPRTNDIKIEEVLQAPANIAVLGALNWDDKWVFSKLPPEKTKQVWVMSAKGQDLQDKLTAEALESNIPNFKPHFPPMDGNAHTMHSKLMLLFHQTHLRIVVPTANMIKFDWGETNKDEKGESWQSAVIENSLFLIDLPRRPDGQTGRKGLTHFGSELIDFLEAQKIGENVVEGVLKFDFSETQNIGFVHSIPGSLTARFSESTGLSGLASCLRRLELDGVDMKTMELDYAVSSLGAVKESFLKRLYSSAACGQSSRVPPDFLERIRVYYPTRKAIMESTGGPDCGGIITFKRSYYNSPGFPKQCMRNYKSTRPGVLSHNKILLARGRKADGSAVAWAYVGSANLSASAWGEQRELKSGSQGKLTVRNWECGVVVPVPAEVLGTLKLKDGEVPAMDVFKGVVEVPFQYPGERYDGEEPWFFTEHA